MNNASELPTEIKGASATLLVVDDEKNILSSLKRLLQVDGYHLLTAESASEALALLEAHPVDLVISDMYMPEMNGVELLCRIAQNYPETIRILLTGFSDMNLTVEAVNRGRIYQYINKPWDNDEIRLIVRRGVEFKKSEDERRQLLEVTRSQNEMLSRLNAELEQKVEARTAELRQALMMKDSANTALRASYTEAIKVLSNILEARADVIAGHSKRVAEHSIAIARRLKISDTNVRNIMYAALLHDIGKIGYKDDLIMTPYASMSSVMKKQVSEHPALGFSMLTEMGGLEKTATIIRHHHEMYDGSGFPDGLKMDAIPLGARILSVANEYDNLLSGTLMPYRVSKNSAREFLIANKGKRYDPIVVDVFLSILAHDKTQPTPSSEDQSIFGAASLREGMILTKDVVSKNGIPIMPKGTVLNQQKINRLQTIENALDTRLEVSVRS